MLAKVYDLSPKGMDWAVNWFAISLLMDTYPLPPIFLVIKFKHCTIGGQHEVVRHGFGKAMELPCPRFHIERDVLQFELNRLLCIVLFAFNGVFSNAKEVIKRDD